MEAAAGAAEPGAAALPKRLKLNPSAPSRFSAAPFLKGIKVALCGGGLCGGRAPQLAHPQRGPRRYLSPSPASPTSQPRPSSGAPACAGQAAA